MGTHRKRAILTGGSGAVVPAIGRTLHKAGYRVEFAGRNKPAVFDGADPTFHPYDLLDPASRLNLEGVDVLVHGAALSPRHGASPRMLTRVNSEATEALAREAIRAGVRTVVFLSSVSVYGGRGGVLTEDTEGEALDAYGESKRTAERALVALAKDIRIRIVRLPGVLGPRAETPWLTKVAQAFLEQRRVTFSRPNEPFNHAIGDGDVARWVLKAAEEISSEPWVHNLAAGEPMMLRDALLLLRSSLGSFSALEEVEPTKAHALIDVERACCALGELPTLRDVLSNYASEVLATRG